MNWIIQYIFLCIMGKNVASLGHLAFANASLQPIPME